MKLEVEFEDQTQECNNVLLVDIQTLDIARRWSYIFTVSVNSSKAKFTFVSHYF
jgi:hypothetical protein